MGPFSALSDIFREGRDALRLQEESAVAGRVVAYAEDVATWSVLGPYLETLVETGRSEVLYVTSARHDPRLASSNHQWRSVFLSLAVPWWLSRLRARAFLTTMPDLGRVGVARPPATTPCVYAFHSLVSTHEAYRSGAFDHYDVFFCTGPHHRTELEAHFRRLGRPIPELLEVGYARLDSLSARFAARPRTTKAAPTVLVAPSWGAGNVLEAAGTEVVTQLRGLGFRVIVRPHPCFWLPIYPKGREHVQRVIERFAGDSEVIVERNINSDEAYLEADLVISDFSGAAYEYAFATRRPVLFFDGARKTLNPGWQELGLPTFEDAMRGEVGEIIAPKRIAEVGHTVKRLLGDAPAWADRLAELHHRHVYNPGRSAQVGAAALHEIASRSPTPSR